MNQLFKTILEEYLDGEKVDNKNKEYHKIICKRIPENIGDMINDEKYIVKGSCGSSLKADVPWIGIFDKRITTSAQKGIYIVYLFRADMKGFYLCLAQGVTNFNKYKKEKNKYIEKTVDYFKEQINDQCSFKDKVKLYSKVSRGKDYEKASIIAKYYDKSKMKEYNLEEDLKEIIEIYKDVCQSIEDFNYDEAIENIIKNEANAIMNIDKAKKIIERTIGNEKETVLEKARLSEIDIPKSKTTKKERTRRISKTDYVKKAKQDEQTGLNGESQVMDYEREKMESHNREDLIEKINWVSLHDDNKGYDIESFDFDEDGKEYRIYIEVKTTKGNEDTNFFITKNEINRMKELGEKYWIYRVCKINGEPKFFKIRGTEFNEKIILEEYEYIAKVK